MNFINGFVKRHSFSLKAEGASMLPILHSGDVVYYQKTAFKNIKTNDLVLIKKNNKLFTHRTIYKKILRRAQDDGGEGFLITKGDGNLQSDGRIYPKQLIAKATQVRRDGRLFDPEDLYLLQSTHL